MLESSRVDSKLVAPRSLSLSYYTVPELSFPDMMEVAARAGCNQVGVRLLDGAPDGTASPLLLSAALRREARSRMAELGLTALEASAARIRPATRISDFQPFLAACAELGVRHVMCTIDDNDSARGTAKLAQLCEMSRRHGLRVEIEFVPWMSVGSLADAVVLVRDIATDNLGIVVDALHFDRSHGRPEEVAALPPAWFRFLQVCDAPVCTDYSIASQLHVATQERLFPGEGSIALVALLRAAPQGIPLALEIPTAALSKNMPALERVQRAVAATHALLAAAEHQ
jgi:sugar phosphate isomerase/epimerase